MGAVDLVASIRIDHVRCLTKVPTQSSIGATSLHHAGRPGWLTFIARRLASLARVRRALEGPGPLGFGRSPNGIRRVFNLDIRRHRLRKVGPGGAINVIVNPRPHNKESAVGKC